MKLPCLMFLATAPPFLAGVLPVTASAADAITLEAVAATALPHSTDRRFDSILATHKGKPVLVNFWATWCPPCREEMPALGRLAARWQERGLAVQTIAIADNPRAVADFLWEALPDGQALPVMHDRDQLIGRAWEVRVLPTTVVLDRRHRIVLRGTGAIDWDAAHIDRQLEKLFN